MADSKLTLPSEPKIVMPPVLPQLPNDPRVIERFIQLLDAQLVQAQDAALQVQEKNRLKDQDRKARLANAKQAKVEMEATLAKQAACPHEKAPGRSALGVFHGFPHPVTMQARTQIFCSKCQMTDEGDPQEMRNKYANVWPPKQAIGGVTVDTDY